MSDELNALDKVLETIFDKHFDRATRTSTGDAFPASLWKVLSDAGMTTLGDVSEGVGIAEIATVARATGRAAAPVPLVESTGIASWLASASGIALPQGLIGAAVAHRDDLLKVERAATAWTVSGQLHRVPWGRHVDEVISVASSDEGPIVLMLPVGEAEVVFGRNLAGEPRDAMRWRNLQLDSCRGAQTPYTADDVLLRGALLRSAEMVGALQAIAQLTLDYAATRQQFGKPLGSFQGVARHLVVVSGEAMCAQMALECALSAPDHHRKFAIAAAKLVAGEAARRAARAAHQVHAAIGVTEEHSLSWFTKRLWAWEDEFGTTGLWAARLGSQAVSGGGAGLWPLISTPAAPNPTAPES